MQNFIWHNPRCSKSRQTLALIEAAGIAINCIDYQSAPPSIAEISAACAGLACEPTTIIRHKEALFAELGLAISDKRSAADWIQILHQHPRLIERPIVRIGKRYAIGRPPENVQDLF